MRDAMQVLAQFDQFQNRKLFRILDTLSDEERKKNRKMAYTLGSIHGALDRLAGTLGMGAKMMGESEGPQEGPPAGGFGGPADPEPLPPPNLGKVPPQEQLQVYEIENYEALKTKILEADQAYVEGFDCISEEQCLAGGIPLYDMCMKGFLIATSTRGAISQVLAEMGIECDLIFGALLSED